MDNATTYAHTQLATWVALLVNNTAISAPAITYYAALFVDTANPSLAGTEFSMAGYARKAVAWTNSGVTLLNSNAMTWTTTLGSTTWGGTALFDAASGGNRWFFEDYSPRLSISSSSPASLPIGAVEIDFS